MTLFRAFVDAETHLVKRGMPAPRSVCWAIHVEQIGFDMVFGPPPPARLFDRESGLDELERLLADPTCEIIGHNFAYDACVAIADRPRLIDAFFVAYEAGRVRCTMTRQALLDIAAGEHKFFVDDESGKAVKSTRSLSDVSMRLLGEHLEKENTRRLDYGSLDGVPLELWTPEDAEYPLNDVRATRRVFHAQSSDAEHLRTVRVGEDTWVSAPGEIPDEGPQTFASFWLQLFSIWGVRTDGDAVREFKTKLEKVRDDAHRVLVPLGIVRADGSKDMKVLQARITSAYGGRPPMTFPSNRFPEGQVKTDSETLRATTDEALIILGDSMTAMSELNKDVPQLELGVHRPICTRYNSPIESGRHSSSQPNMLNPPRREGMRECHVARPGRLFAFCDLDTIELRALGQACLWLVGWSHLADAIIRGEDPHLALGAELEGLSYEEAKRLYDAGDVAIAEARQLAKIPNFGLPGGLGEDSFIAYAHGYDDKYKKIVDRPMARRLIDAWFRKWGEMRRYFQLVKSAVGATGEGAIQQLVSLRVRGGCTFTQAANTVFQGMAADGAKRAGGVIARECYVDRRSALYGSRPWLFLYDEFGVEVLDPAGRPEVASRAALRIGEIMRKEVAVIIPDVPIACTPVLSRRWRKGCKAVKDAAGNLRAARPVKIDGKVKWEIDHGVEERIAA